MIWDLAATWSFGLTPTPNPDGQDVEQTPVEPGRLGYPEGCGEGGKQPRYPVFVVGSCSLVVDGNMAAGA